MGASTSSTLTLSQVSTTFDNLPTAYKHLSQFPVLAKQAKLRRGPVRSPNDHVQAFLRNHWNLVSRVGDYLSVWDKLNFLKTHK